MIKKIMFSFYLVICFIAFWFKTNLFLKYIELFKIDPIQTVLNKCTIDVCASRETPYTRLLPTFGVSLFQLIDVLLALSQRRVRIPFPEVPHAPRDSQRRLVLRQGHRRRSDSLGGVSGRGHHQPAPLRHQVCWDSVQGSSLCVSGKLVSSPCLLVID